MLPAGRGLNIGQYLAFKAFKLVFGMVLILITGNDQRTASQNFNINCDV